MLKNIRNGLAVSGANEAVDAFFEAIGGGVDESNFPICINFEKIKPMPDALRIECGSRNDGALKLYTEFAKESAGIAEIGIMMGDKGADTVKRLTAELMTNYNKRTEKDPELLSFGEKLFNNIRDYGAPTWYEWSIQNWGSKWNAYSQERLDDTTILFDTANKDVRNLMQELSNKYPDLLMSYKFAEEQWGNHTGEFEFEGGECNYELVPDNHSEEARAIARELLGNEPVREEEAEEENEGDEDWEDEL
jgi:hypothetical protein